MYTSLLTLSILFSNKYLLGKKKKEKKNERKTALKEQP